MSVLKTEYPINRPVRFPPDPMDYAQIAFRNPGEPFHPDTVALIYDESPLNGCALVVLDDPLLVVDTLCQVKVGRMDPVRARIAWRKPIEPRLIHLGLEFLE